MHSGFKKVWFDFVRINNCESNIGHTYHQALYTISALILEYFPQYILMLRFKEGEVVIKQGLWYN